MFRIAEQLAARAQRQPVTEVRYSAGVVSSRRRKRRVMWLWSEKPQLAATTLSGMSTALQLALGMLDAPAHDIGVRRAAEFGAEFADEMEDAELHHAGHIRERYVLVEMFVDILD